MLLLYPLWIPLRVEGPLISYLSRLCTHRSDGFQNYLPLPHLGYSARLDE